MLKVIRHRPVQACVIALLSALVTACAVFTPLYQRALDQASVGVELDRAERGTDLLQLTSNGLLPSRFTGSGRRTRALTAAELIDLMPRTLQRSFRDPVDALFVGTTSPPDETQPTAGSLVWRDGSCAHLSLVAGRCASGAREIVVSTADAANFGWRPGSRITVLESQPEEALDAPVEMTLEVVGTYRVSASAYWDGWALTGVSGTNPDRTLVYHDTWLTDRTTFTAEPTWRNPSSQVDLAVDRDTVHVDEMLALGAAVDDLQRAALRRPVGTAIVLVRTRLPAIAAAVREDQEQSRATIPALMVPLGVLGLVVLWMALGGAVEQRRPELALARLRGRGPRGAQALLLRELLTVVLAGVPVGFLLALAAFWPIRATALPPGVPTELRAPVWAALGLSAVVVGVTAVLVTYRIGREPIVALLRRIPERRTGWGLGTAEAVVVTVALLIVGAFATGRLTGPIAMAAPAVLALAGGLVLARLLVPLATWSGRRLLGRGSTTAGVAMLQLARRPGARATIALLTVSAGILVFAGDAVSVGSRNRDLAAAQQVGAPLVATIAGGTLPDLRRALAAAHLSAGEATPVVVQRPLADEDMNHLYVDRDSFPAVATFPDQGAARAAFRQLQAPDVAPIEIRTRTLSVQVATESFYEGADHPVQLGMRLLREDGSVASVPVAELTAGTSAAHRFDVPVDCAAGCTLTGWVTTTVPANAGTGRIVIGPLRADDGTRIDPGSTDDWRPIDANGSRLNAVGSARGALTVFVDNAGASDLLLEHAWVPASLPSVVSGALPADSAGREFSGPGLDGVRRAMTAVDRLSWLPASGANASVTDLDLAARTGGVLDEDARLQVWFAEDDPTVLASLRKSLDAQEMVVAHVDRTSTVRRSLAESAATWSLQLGVLVGLACLAVAVLGLAVAAAGSWRLRARDLAVLRLHGTSAREARRISVGEQLPAVLAAVLTGSAGGLLAAHFALPAIPLLATDPPVDLVDLSPSWAAVLGLTAAAVLVIGGFAAWMAALVARRTTPARSVGAP